MKWIYENVDVLWHASLSAVILLVIVTIVVRINGLRSFAKMSSIDFVTTITIGSVICSTIMTDSNSILKGGLAIGVLLIVQTIFSLLKMKTDWFSAMAENKPIFLYKNDIFIEANLTKSKVSKNDVIAKLREANAYDLNKVHAVVLESTGDISVIHGDNAPAENSPIYKGISDL